MGDNTDVLSTCMMTLQLYYLPCSAYPCLSLFVILCVCFSAFLISLCDSLRVCFFFFSGRRSSCFSLILSALPISIWIICLYLFLSSLLCLNFYVCFCLPSFSSIFLCVFVFSCPSLILPLSKAFHNCHIRG